MMKSIKGMVKSLLIKTIGETRWVDYELCSGRIDKTAYYDKLTELAMKKTLMPTSVCIDVGCHDGSILSLMMKYAPNGTFLAFEPLPHLYERLVQSFPYTNVRIFDLALSNTAGESAFNYVVSRPAYSGIVKRRYDRPAEIDTEIIVKTQRLDTVLADADVAPVSLIKIDVEGAEYLVIDGGQSRIARDKPLIIFEHGMGGSDCYNKGPEEVFDLLCSRCGLRVSLISDWLRGKPPLDVRALPTSE